MNRIIYKVLQRSLSLQYFECNSTLRNLQTLPILVSRPLVTNCGVLQQKTDTTNASKTTDAPNAAAMAKKKLKLSPKITLIDQNKSLTVTSLEEAQKLAKRRDLHLVLVEELDTKTQRPVYKLATTAGMLAEELEELHSGNKTSDKDKSAHKKAEKSLTIGSRISEHDLESRLKNISKWLAKQHEVRVLIQGSSNDTTSGEQIVKTIDQSIKEPKVIGRIVQKRVKGQVIKFNILPVAPTVTQA